jgi:hypothetical protein
MALLTFFAVPWGTPISDLTGLEHAVNLETLGLCAIQLETVPEGLFAGMTKLRNVNLCCNSLTDIGPLAEAPSLAIVQIHQNQISDISPLASLPSLRELKAEDNNISDISPLVGLTHLEQLNLLANPLSADACTIHIPQIITDNPGITIQENAYIEPGSDLLVNGGFEEGKMAPWGIGPGATAEVVSTLEGAVVEEVPVEGNYCLHVTVPTPGEHYWSYGLDRGSLLFRAGKQYTLSAYFKCRQGTLRTEFLVRWAAGSWTCYAQQTFTVSDTWRRYSVTTPVFPRDTEPGEVKFHFGFDAGEFWIDDIRLIED